MKHSPPQELYGLNCEAIARALGVDPSTVRRWKRGARKPPPYALALIGGDLGCFSPKWRGWHFKGDILLSPEELAFTPGDVRSVPYLKAVIASYQLDKRRAREEEKMIEQPGPEDWGAALEKLQASGV
jgi:transcriptional regulator with XRE-family HTH domain